MKPLDFVKTPDGSIALVAETNTSQGRRQASIVHIGGTGQEKSAWWNECELTVIDSLPYLLARKMAHPFGSGDDDADRFFRPSKS